MNRLVTQRMVLNAAKAEYILSHLSETDTGRRAAIRMVRLDLYDIFMETVDGVD